MNVTVIKITACFAATIITINLTAPVFAKDISDQTEIQTEAAEEVQEEKSATVTTMSETETVALDENFPEQEAQSATKEEVESEEIMDSSEMVVEKNSVTETAKETITNWEWNDKDNVIQDNTIDIVCKNENYMLTYQNFSACLPDKIILGETEDISIKEWQCKEINLEPGTELLSLHKDSIHLNAVFDKQYKLNPDPLITIRFLKLTPTGKFTGKETGIWKWVVKNN